MEHFQPDGDKQKHLQVPFYAPERAAETPDGKRNVISQCAQQNT